MTQSKMTQSRSALPILAALAIALGLAGCQRGALGGAKAAAPPPPATPYSAIADGKADVEGGIINVAARTPGVIREVDVQEGQTVAKGQVLARQEDDAQRLAARTAMASLQQARAQIGLTRVQMAAAQREYDRLLPLSSSQFVARQALDQARDAIHTAQANLAAQEAAVVVAATQLDQAKYAEELTIIRAPADGRIVRRYANPGAGASTLNVSTMFDLEPAGQRIVRAEVSEGAEPFVLVGQKVQLVPEADQSKVYPGTVLRIAPVFGARKLQSDDPSERTDERVVETVVTADGAPFLIGQRVLVKFLKS
ncbi:MAG: HlyD family secretion protein [Caulobacterales bacterium]